MGQHLPLTQIICLKPQIPAYGTETRLYNVIILIIITGGGLQIPGDGRLCQLLQTLQLQ